MRPLSVVVPAYNEERRLGATLERLAADLPRDAEVIVVDDGSVDGTAAIAAAAAPRVRLLRLPHNRGKGAAVRAGMLAAEGARVLFTDADLSTPIDERARLEAALDAGADVAIGSRAHPDARVERHQPWYRERLGKAFNGLVHAAVGLHRWGDTQCGFKLFTRDAARAVFSRCVVDGFAFDVEALLVAQDLGLRVAEVPVRWADHPETRVGLVHGAPAMAADVLRIAHARRRRPASVVVTRG